MVERKVYGPVSEKQSMFMASESDITLFGGSAMCGKTFSSLLKLTKYLNHPKTEAMFLRKTYSSLRQPGSAWFEACSLYKELYPGLRIQTRDMRLIFPSGAVLKFGHCPDNILELESLYKGAQISVLICDELSEYSEESALYVMSRVRSVNVDYKPLILWVSNPHASSFVVPWLKDRYLDEYGFPIESMCNVEMYFHKTGNEIKWYKDLFTACSVHGFGKDAGILSFRFIPSLIFDNTIAMEKDAGYVNKLKSLSTVECNRLLYGNWYAVESTASMYSREFSKMVELPNGRATKRVRAWDLAATPKTETNNPDFSAGVLISKDRDSVYTVEDVVRIQDRPHVVEQLIFSTALKDGRDVTISIPQDPGASAISYSKSLQRRLAELGYTVRMSKPTKAKALRFKPFSAIAEAGYVNIVSNPDWTKFYLDELESFTGETKGRHGLKDDCVDATSDAIAILNTQVSLPTNLSLPDLSKGSNGSASSIDDFSNLSFSQ